MLDKRLIFDVKLVYASVNSKSVIICTDNDNSLNETNKKCLKRIAINLPSETFEVETVFISDMYVYRIETRGHLFLDDTKVCMGVRYTMYTFMSFLFMNIS